LKKGDLLLEIDPTPYQNAADQIDAQLKAAKANVKQSLANLAASHANAKKVADAVQQALCCLSLPSSAGKSTAAKRMTSGGCFWPRPSHRATEPSCSGSLGAPMFGQVRDRQSLRRAAFRLQRFLIHLTLQAYCKGTL
jgi:hypothetical protein